MSSIGLQEGVTTTKVAYNEKQHPRIIQEDVWTRHVSGIVLKSGDVKELVRIAKLSVPIIEMRLDDIKLSNGSSFMYKQVVFKDKGISRCYFLTNLHVVQSISQSNDVLQQAVAAGANIDNLSLKFVINWYDQEYPVERFLLPKEAFFSLSKYPKVQHLDFALFHVDVETTDVLDFFGIAQENTIDIGDKIYAFGYPQGLNLTLSDGIVSHVYHQYREGIDNPITKGAIQHNILINQGNSGGPTVSELGEIVGISTRGFVSSVAVGINFSINIRGVLGFLNESHNLDIVSMKDFVAKRKEQFD